MLLSGGAILGRPGRLLGLRGGFARSAVVVARRALRLVTARTLFAARPFFPASFFTMSALAGLRFGSYGPLLAGFRRRAVAPFAAA
jgi:hypothetical protein